MSDRAESADLPPIAITFPTIRNLADVEALESVPQDERVRGVWDVNPWIRRGLSYQPDKAAFHFLASADPDRTPLTVSCAELLHLANQAANLLRSLGVGPGDAVLLAMPTIPQLFPAQFGALAQVLLPSARVRVEVGPDDTHGTIVRIEVTGCEAKRRGTMEEVIHGVVKAHPLHYEISFSGQTR